MKRKIIFLYLILSMTTTLTGFSQRFGRRSDTEEGRQLYEQSRSVYLEALNLVSEDGGKSRLDINFRIERNFFVFVRDTSNGVFPFVARGDVTVEVLDSNRVSVARELVTKQLDAKESPAPGAGAESVEGIFSFDLPSGTYTIVSEVKDRESDRRYFDDTKRVTLKNFSASSLELSDVVLMEASKAGPDTSFVLTPLNFGGDVPFGGNYRAYLEIPTTRPRDSLFVTYSIHRKSESQDRVEAGLDTLAPVDLFEGKALKVEQKQREYLYRLTGTSAARKYGILLPVRGDTLEQGSYEFEFNVRAGSETKSVKHDFHVRWVGMPRSLQNLEIAVEALKYIMSEDEFKEIKNSQPRNRRRLFEEFWRKRDPSPGTAYNEAMAEYYRRVDEATPKFATVHEQDGVRTERGKAFILYGPPARVERSLSPSDLPREIWYYDRLHKKLTFMDENRNGDYKLVDEEPLQSGK